MKRRGQFMDIVHPSRDMNTLKPVGRQGVTIQPGNDVVAASAGQQSEAPVVNSAETTQEPAELRHPQHGQTQLIWQILPLQHQKPQLLQS